MYNGLLPSGVTKDEAGVSTLDRDARYCDLGTRREIAAADGLLMAFELAGAGRTVREIARAPIAAGYHTTGNSGMNPFTKDSVRVILRNLFFIGELPDGNGSWLPGKRGALIDPDLFVRASKARESNSGMPRRVVGVRSPWALSGVTVCSSCGAPIVATGNGTGRRRIECAGRKHGLACAEQSRYAEIIEDQIGAALSAFRIPESDRDMLLTL